MARAALLLLLAASARGLSTAGWPIQPEESARLDAAHEAVVARMPPVLDAIEAGRRAYEAGAEKDALFAAWGSRFAEAHRLIGEQEKLWLAHDEAYKRLEVRLITRAVDKATSGRPLDPVAEEAMRAIYNRNQAMRARKDKQLNRFWQEGDRYRAVEESRRLEATRRGQGRGTGLMAGAGLAVLLLAAAAWRYARPAPDPVALPAPAGPTLPPLVGGNIELVRPIGRGGMGEVYEGLDRTLQRRVALKRLRPELTNSPSDLSRLLKEARLVAALKHPNIVQIHSVEREAGQVFLVFEYVAGETLAARIAARRRLPWAEAAAVFQAAAAALEYAHSRGIVHRDLKPANIMLGDKDVVKVMDFGLAHEAAQAVSRLTSAGGWGTPPYMAPEQELGETGAAVDLFALSVCLYEMLCGEVPFTGPNFLAQKRERVYPPASSVAPGLPQGVDMFFAAAFDPDPSRRFPDAKTLAAAARAVSDIEK